MTQYARPDGDVTKTNIGGGTYASIDETSASDADFVYGNENVAATFECSLSNITDPSGNVSHTFNYRVVKLNNTTPDGGGNACYVTASLYQGATLKCADTQKTLDGSWTTYSKTLSTAEADSITDYNDLRLRFVSPASGGSAASRRAMGVSWAEFQTPDAPVTDDMTALDIVSGTPTIEAATLGQKHALTSQDVVSGTPAIEVVTLGQKHVLTALDILSGTPTIEQATAGEEVADTEDDLTALDIVSGTPTIEAATLGQKHALVSLDVVSGTPTVEAPTVGQKHALTSLDVVSGQPTVELSTIGQVHVLTSLDIVSGTPTIEEATAGEPAVGEDTLTALDIVSGTPTIEQATIGQKHVLTSTDILSATPTLETPTIGQIHGLTLADVLFGTPTLEASTIGQVHALLSQDITSGTPTIELMTAGTSDGVDELVALDIELGTPTIERSQIRHITKQALARYRRHSSQYIKQRRSHSTVYPDGSFDDNYHIRNR